MAKKKKSRFKGPLVSKGMRARAAKNLEEGAMRGGISRAEAAFRKGMKGTKQATAGTRKKKIAIPPKKKR